MIVSLISVIIEAIVAGLSGALTALISIHLQNKSNRRTAHLIKHKQNFQIIEDAIRKVCSDVVPCTKMDSKENPDIEISYAENSDIWKFYSIFNSWSEPKEQSKDNEIAYVTINRLLYKDIQKHWYNLYKDLDKWITSINNTGQTLSESTKCIFDEIKNNLDQEKLHLYSSVTFHNPPIQELTSECIYLAIYNYLMGYNENEWPNISRRIHNIKLKDNNKDMKLDDDIQEILEKLRSDKNVNKAIAELKNLAPSFLHSASEIIDELDQIMLSEKIEGSCEYI